MTLAPLPLPAVYCVPQAVSTSGSVVGDRGTRWRKVSLLSTLPSWREARQVKPGTVTSHGLNTAKVLAVDALQLGRMHEL